MVIIYNSSTSLQNTHRSAGFSGGGCDDRGLVQYPAVVMQRAIRIILQGGRRNRPRSPPLHHLLPSQLLFCFTLGETYETSVVPLVKSPVVDYGYGHVCTQLSSHLVANQRVCHAGPVVRCTIRLPRGVVWCGVVWCGVLWCGVVWRSVVS